MGEKVGVGSLIYNVIETEWKSQLGENLKARIPNHRFLLVRLTVTNGGPQESAAPLLSLEDSKGNTYRELSDGEGVPEWLGLLRLIGSAQTEQGRILFDAPPGAYRLRVSDAGEPETEKIALIDLPLQLDSELPAPPTQ